MFDLITWPVFLAAFILSSKLVLIVLVVGVAGWHIYFKYFDKESKVEKNRNKISGDNLYRRSKKESSKWSLLTKLRRRAHGLFFFFLT